MYLRSFNGDKQHKLKLKRAATEKQDHDNKVVEEDDDSFASDTPSRVKRNGNKPIGDFDQAIKMHYSPPDRKHRKNKMETSPTGFLTEDGKNINYLVASKKISANGVDDESPEQMYHDTKGDSN